MPDPVDMPSDKRPAVPPAVAPFPSTRTIELGTPRSTVVLVVVFFTVVVVSALAWLLLAR